MLKRVLKVETIMANVAFDDFTDGPRTIIHPCEIKNIDEELQKNKKYIIHNNKEYRMTLAGIINYMCRKDIDFTFVDIDEMDKSFAPTKEMTIEEIQKELGYKIKIVDKKED